MHRINETWTYQEIFKERSATRARPRAMCEFSTELKGPSPHPYPAGLCYISLCSKVLTELKRPIQLALSICMV